MFAKRVQGWVFGGASWRIADATCAATTLRRRRDEGSALGSRDRLRELVIAADDQMLGRERGDLAGDGCITTAPCGGAGAGRRPVDRGKPGLERSTVGDAQGLPRGAIAAPANRHASPRLEATLDTLDALGPLPAPVTVHRDRGDDADATRDRLARRCLHGALAQRGQPAPVAASQRWPGERTTAWTHAPKKLVWGTERRHPVIAFWLALSAVIIIVRRPVRQGWTRSRRDGRPARRP